MVGLQCKTIKTMKKITTLLILLISISVTSQNLKPFEKPFIEVTGKAEKEIVPDEIYIDICLEERMEKGEKITIEQQENELKRELSSVGIPLKNLSIGDINAVIVKTGWWRKDVLAKANYELKVDGASQLKKVFKVFEKLKITNAYITKATHSKIEEFRKETRIKAIKMAKQKADDLLNAIGEKTGKPLVVNNISSKNQQDFVLANHTNRSVSKISYESEEQSSYKKRSAVQFQKIKISSTFYVKFEIK